MKYPFILIVIFCLCRVINAQDSLTVFTLQQCIDVSLKNNIQLKQNELNVETAEVSKRMANEARLPTLNANVNPGYNLGRSIDPSTNQFKDQNYLQGTFGISSNLVLFNGFRISNVIRQNRYSSEAVQFELKDFKNTLLLSVLSGYVQILYNKEALTNAKNQLQSTQAQVMRTEKLVKAGVLPESNLLDLISKAANEESLLINAENQLNIAKLNLIQFMNLPLEKYKIETIDIETPAIIDTSSLIDTPNDIYTIAEKSQPSIKGAELRYKSLDYAYSASRGNLYPRLSLGLTSNSYYSELNRPFNPASLKFEEVPFNEQFKNNLAHIISLSLAIPIYNNRQARGGTENANINRKNSQLNYQNSKVQLRKKIEQAFVDAKGAQKKFDAVQAQVLANEESFRVTEKRFNSGVINSVDYTISSNTLNQARSSLIQAKYDLILKKKILEFYKYNDIQF